MGMRDGGSEDENMARRSRRVMKKLRYYYQMEETEVENSQQSKGLRNRSYKNYWNGRREKGED